MPAGNNSKRLMLQKPHPNAVRGEDGLPDLTLDASWIDAGPRFFEVLPQSGREFYLAQQVESQLTHLLRTHWDALTKTIKPTWRLKFIHEEGRMLQIISVRNLEERNRTVEISCIEVT